jgi:hypothetical protein
MLTLDPTHPVSAAMNRVDAAPGECAVTSHFAHVALSEPIETVERRGFRREATGIWVGPNGEVVAVYKFAHSIPLDLEIGAGPTLRGGLPNVSERDGFRLVEWAPWRRYALAELLDAVSSERPRPSLQVDWNSRPLVASAPKREAGMTT